MGVAFGAFLPSDQYNSDAHANVIDGEYLGDRGESLTAIDDQHSTLETASIAIEDYGDLGRQLTLFFRDGESFAALFAVHPDYRAYYPHLDNGG
ncbi:hypothetical protein KX816_17090 [Sphingosinicellaceae bacterium]|nr:hypothetical protein KX816_17090 [Sphingosinicellaceae bacterium]